MIFIDWNDVEVSRRLNDGDVVTATSTGIDPGFTEFQIQLADWLSWWKGIQLLNNTNQQIGFIEVQDDRKVSEPLRVRTADIEVGAKLVLWKAKMFGVHTPMYVLADLERKGGQRVTFRWTAD